MTLLGQFALWVALLVGLWAVVVSFGGRWEHRPELSLAVRRAPLAISLALWVAALALWKGLFAHDFSIEYVYAYTSRNLPTHFLISAFWAGQKGSLLFWAVVLSSFGALTQVVTAERHRALLPYVAGVTSTVVVFFVSVMLFSGSGNPFERVPFMPPDGRGLNPQLQHPGMVFHPPMLYLGYISLTIPAAFAIAALLSRRVEPGWIHAMRKWALLSWTFLSIGITLGMWWAYLELGWGGYWSWDPVENASLLPWLTNTAFLHSVMVQEKRGMLKRWNMGLVLGSFLLSIFGTFITRSGVIASVHSFTQSNVGYFFLGFLILAGGLGFTLLYTRWPALAPEAELDSLASRESAFLFNNLVLVGIAFSVLWGTLFPILSEAVQGVKITVGPPFFNRVNVPLGLLLLALTGIGPLIAWRRASAANLKRQFTVPVSVGLATVVALLIAGLRDGYVAVALGLAGFVVGTVAQEFWRGARARHRLYGEAPLAALVRLVAGNRRRYGGYLVHIGIVIYFVAFTGSVFRTTQEATLRTGDTIEVPSPFGHSYTLTHMGISQYQAENRFVTAATLEVRRGGKSLGIISTEKRQYLDSFGRNTFQPSTEVGLLSGVREDLYVIFAGSVDGTERSTFTIHVNPLVWWVWVGGVVLTIGGIMTMWPGGWRIEAAPRAARAEPDPAEAALV